MKRSVQSESFQDMMTFVSLCNLKTESTQVANAWIMCYQLWKGTKCTEYITGFQYPISTLIQN